MIKEKFKLYSYQDDAKDFILNNIDESNVLAAAAPNAGKTIITSFVVRHLVSKGKRILCSVHGTNTLKRQFYKSICKIVGIENVSIYDTSDLSLYDPEKPVQIMIYQNIRQMEECVDLHGKFDYLIVDEAHKFYDGTNSMDIISKKYVSGNHLLLTGSPAIFKEKINSGEIRAIYISASLIDSVHSGQYDKDIRLDVVSNDVHLTIDDYNQDGEVISESQNKLTNNDVVLESLLVGEFGKTIIYVKRTKQADEIETYLNNRSIVNFISHSKTDKDSSNIDNFKKNYSGVDDVVLIVVGRATEGYDDPNVSIIDLTYTKNIDTLYQRYSRGIRKRTDAKYKRYVKVVPNNDNSAEVFIHIMTAVLMLLKQEHYESFNGKNFSIPTLKQVVKTPKSGVGEVRSFLPKKKHETDNINDNNIIIKSSDKPQSVKELVENSNFVVNIKIDDQIFEIKENDFDTWVNTLKDKEYLVTIEKSNDKVDDCLLMETKLYSGSFFDTKNELYGLITRYATSSLQDVLREIRKSGYDINTIDECVNVGLNLKIRNSRNWRDRHSEILETTKLKLPHSPWETFNLEGGAPEFSRLLGYDDSYGVNNIEDIIDLCKKYDVNSPNKWVEKYKIISEHEEIKLMVRPWETFSIDKKEFSKMLGWSYDVETIEDCVLIAKKYNIVSSSNWSDEYKKISEYEKIKLPSSPWETFNLEGGAPEFSRLLGYDVIKLSSEEHFKICVENRLTSIPEYQKFIENNEKIPLYKVIWTIDGKTAKDYFEDVKKHLGVNFLSIEDTFNFCVHNNIITGSIYKEFRVKTKKLHSRPWKLVNKTQLEYFEDIKNKLGLNTNTISIEETYKICLDNNLITGVKYRKYVDTNTHLNLYKAPWSATGLSQMEFFGKIKKMLDIGVDYLTIEETFNLCVENKLIHSRLYYDYRKKNTQIKIFKEPWIKVGKTMVQFFDEVKISLGFNKLTYDETIDLCVKNQLISGPLYSKYMEVNPEINFFITPWTIKNIKQKEFFNIVKEKLNITQYSLDEIFNLCVKNELINGSQYQKFCKKNEDLNLILNPWVSLKKSREEYFQEVRDFINERIKMEREYRPAYLGEFSEINKNWNTSNSNTTHKKLLKDKSEWIKYHDLYSKARLNWSEIPYIEISKIIKDRPDWVIGDFGCGENLLSKEIENKVYAFDHVSIDENVVSCDLTNVPLDNNSLDVAVFSLSLMGTNYIEYLKEAYRVLKPMAQIFISEPSKRWEGRENELKDILINIGFSIIGDVKHSDRFIYINGIKI